MPERYVALFLLAAWTAAQIARRGPLSYGKLAFFATFVAAFLLPTLALAQSPNMVQQSGDVTPGHAMEWITNGVAADAGGAASGNLTELGITASGTPFCINDGPVTQPFHQLCLGAASQGGALLSFEAYGGAPQEPFSINLNGQVYPFPGPGSGTVVGPPTTTIGTLPVWSGALGTTLNNGPITQITANGTGSVTSVLANSPLGGFYTQGGGPLVNMCPGYNFGCPSVGLIRAQTATVGTSLGDAGTQESEFYSYLINKTGQALPWATSTSYVQGNVTIAAAGANLYVETVASCTSASTGAGPTGQGNGIVDNTCRWTYEGQPGLRGKIAIAATTLVLPGGTDAWAGDFDTFIEPGWLDGFATGMEIDITNNSGRDGEGGNLTVNDLYLGGSVGTAPITAYVSISPFGLNGTNYMAHEGVWIQGQYTTLGHDFRVSTHSQTAFFDDALSVHGTASYLDSSTSPNGLLLEGTYSTGYALVADASIEAVKSAAGADFTGFNVTNTGTTVNTTNANILLNTGNTNSYGRIDLFDSDFLEILSGPALTVGIVLGTSAGNINLNTSGTIAVSGNAGVTCPANTVSLTTLHVFQGIVIHC